MFGRGDGRFHLREEAVILYEGEPSGVSMTHARVYASDQEPAIVIVGELTDNPGVSVASSVEQLAATIDLRWFGGEGRFRLFAYDTDEQTFKEATFEAGRNDEGQERPLRQPVLNRKDQVVGSAIVGTIATRWQARGDWTNPENLVTACGACNSAKADLLLEEIAWRLLGDEEVRSDWDGLTSSVEKLWVRAGSPEIFSTWRRVLRVA